MAMPQVKTPVSTVAAAQNLMWKCGAGGIDLRRRAADWADWAVFFWAGRGARGREEKWVDTTEVVRSEVDGSYERGVCGAGVLIKVFTQALGGCTSARVVTGFNVLVPLRTAFLGGMPCTRVVRYRASHPDVVLGDGEKGLAFSLSNDTERAVTSTLNQVGSSFRDRNTARSSILI